MSIQFAYPGTTQRMLLGVVRLYWLQIGFTYFLMLCEFTSAAFIPLLLGKAVDGLFNNEFIDFYLLIGLSLFSFVFGFLRRRVDTRVFSQVYRDSLLSVINRLLNVGIDKSRIISRAHLIRANGDFLEYTLPLLIGSTIDVIVALLMLWMVLPVVSVIIAIMVISILVLQRIVSSIIFKYEAVWQHATEDVDRAILAGSTTEVNDYLNRGLPMLIGRSDVEAFCWGLVDLLSVVTQLSVVYYLSVGGYTTGCILASVSYCQTVFSKANMFNFLYSYLRQRRLSADLIDGV